MTEIQGSYDELLAAVPDALAGLLDQGDAGGSVAIFVDGKPVVYVWGGFADAAPDPVAAGHDYECVFGHQDNDGLVRADPRRS